MEPYQEFEKAWEQWAQVPNVVACSSGTAALHLALETLQLSPGMEVIVPDLCMIACPRAVVMAGLTPVFVECGDDLLMRPEAITGAITGRTRAIMVVHTYGRVCDMPAIHAIAKRHSLAIVEDRAEVHGADIPGLYDAACWSFYRNKIIAGEEGGAISFRDRRKSAHARQLRCLGFTVEHDFSHVPRGHNYRLANALAILIMDSIRKGNDNLYERRTIQAKYNSLCPTNYRMGPRQAPWVYDLRIPGMKDVTQNILIDRLNSEGIQARHCFKPSHTQLEFRDCKMVGDREHMRKLSQEVIYLPIEPGRTDARAMVAAFDIIGQK